MSSSQFPHVERGQIVVLYLISLEVVDMSQDAKSHVGLKGQAF